MADKKTPAPQKPVPQNDFPLHTLSEAEKVPLAIWDNYNGQPTSPMNTAAAMGISPTSSGWRTITGAAVGYGLCDAGYNANLIGITALGKRIVAPTTDGDDATARIEAALKPRLLREFFTKYSGGKFPRDDIAKNVLVELGLPKERTDKALEIVKSCGAYAGIIRTIGAGTFVDLSKPQISAKQPAAEAVPLEGNFEHSSVEDTDSRPIRDARPPQPTTAPYLEDVRAIFISHGKNKEILDQLRKIVTLGNFSPVISVDKQTTAVPVPEKVFDDMFSCQAAVIHVAVDQMLADADGKAVPLINQNVLIEIGAAMALYRRRIILLVEAGTQMPSNLQGLFRCEYQGTKLDGDATVKLLETLSQIRAMPAEVRGTGRAKS